MNGYTWRSLFLFKEVTTEEVLKQLRCLNVRKAAGYDKIPPKLLKIGADSLCVPLQYLINMSIKTSSFPTNLKKCRGNSNLQKK